MRVGKWLAAVAGIVAAATVAPAAAQESGLYVGGSVGMVQYADSCKNVPLLCDDEDAGFRAFAGYQFNPWIAIEGAYADMGKLKFSGAGINGETEVYGFDVSAVVSWPILDWMSLLGRGGAYRMRAATTGTGVAQSGKTSSGFTYGLGAEFRVGKLAVRAEFQRYDNVGGDPVGEDSLLFYSAGVLFRLPPT